MQPEENKWLVVRQPLPPPTIAPDLEELNAVVRSTECLRFFVLSVEHSLFPNGYLRWWLKTNCCLGALLFIPAIFLMPAISLVLWQVDGCLAMLARIVLKLIVLSILISVAVLAIKHFPSSSKGSSRRRK